MKFTTRPFGWVLWVLILAAAPAQSQTGQSRSGEVPADACSAAQVGKPLSVRPLGPTLRRAHLESLFRRRAPEYRAHFDVQPKLVVYCTLDPFERPAVASGLWLTPRRAEDLPVTPLEDQLISYQQGTKTQRSLSPSNITQREGLALISGAASIGATIVAPDYLGLSPGYTGVKAEFHPYLHAATSARTVTDLIRAVEEARGQEVAAVYLLGYSQGGYVTLAAARQMIAEGGRWAGKLKGVSPLAGPHDLGRRTFEDSLARPHPHATNLYFAYTFLGYNRVYSLTPDLGLVFQAPYAGRITRLFDGRQPFEEVIDALPSTPAQLFQPAFLQGLVGQGNDLVSPVARRSAEIGRRTREVLHQNSLLETPFAPGMRDVKFRFAHAPRDELVPFSSMEAAVRTLRAAGFESVEGIEIPFDRELDPVIRERVHQVVAPGALIDAFNWISGLMNRAAPRT